MAFGGDVHFEGVLAARLQSDPATALDGTVATLVQGAQISMANFDSALTAGTCPDPQTKQYVWFAPPTAITAFHSANLSLVTEANTHGEDCGVPGLQQAIAAADAAKFPVIGIGTAAAQAFAPYRVTLDGQRIAILSATQVFDPTTLQPTWSATASQPGVASAVDPHDLVAAVQAARRTSDTVIVYLTWGTETQSCPNPQQGPLAAALVAAGADIVIGSSAHVQQGSGYLGQALVSYNLGNLAFYDSAPPEDYSGTLVVTATGRHVDSFSWRPALISGGLPQPLTGADATSAVQRWQGLRSCTNLTATPRSSLATAKTQTSVAAALATPAPPANTTTTTVHATTTTAHATTTTVHATTTTVHQATSTTAKKKS
jgi:poly-gamma-glutamate synthesis protein (capsule biosynthesis protein)